MASNSTTDQLSVSKSWELSLYELHRTPQEAITDETEIAVSPRCLHNELMCPICLDMLRKTMTTKECLHRFCSDCIVTALRSGNKECPTCRKKLASKRSLRPDPNFDLLISKIYPSRDDYDAHQTQVLEKLNKSHSQAALVQSISEGIKLQNQTRLQRFTKKPQNENEQICVDSTVTESIQHSTAASVPNGPPEDDSKPSTSGLNSAAIKTEAASDSAESVTESESASEGSWCGPSSSDEIELVFKPHPGENDDDFIKSLKEGSVRYLKTTANATMGHLSKYLETRASIDLGSAFSHREITFSVHIAPNPGHFISLNDSETLGVVVDKYWRNSKPLDLYYTTKKIKKKSSN